MEKSSRLPDGKYVFCWGGLIANAGGMTRAMLKRVNEFKANGVDVTVLLSARGEVQLNAITYYKNIGYSELEDKNFITMQDYLGAICSDPQKKHECGINITAKELPYEQQNDKAVFYLNGEIYAVKVPSSNEKEDVYDVYDERSVHHSEWYYNGQLKNTAEHYTLNGSVMRLEKFYASNGFCFMTILNEQINGVWNVTNAKIFNEKTKEVLNFSSLDYLRRYFFAKYVENLSDENIYVFCDPILDFNPGFKDMEFPGKNIYKIGINHGVGLGGERNWNSTINPRLRDMIENANPPQMDGLILLTKEAMNDFKKRFGNINILYNIPNTTPIPNEIADFSERNLRQAVFIGRIDEKQKQITHLIKAFEKVVKILPDVQLLIYGGGDDVDMAKSLISSLNMEKSIFMMGFTDKINYIYQHAAFSAMSSEFEGQSISMMESFANGCPAVAYMFKYGSLDVIKDGVNGRLVPKNNIEQLAETMVEMFNSPETLKEMSVSARKMIHEYSEERYLSHWEDMLISVTEKHTGKVDIKELDISIAEQNINVAAKRVIFCGIVMCKGSIPPCAENQEQIYIRIYNALSDDYEVLTPTNKETLETKKWRVTFELPLDIFTQKRKLSLRLDWNNSFLYKDFELL